MATAFEEVIGIREGFSGLRSPQPGEVRITGSDPVFSTCFKIGEACAAVLGGVGVAVSDIWEMKTGRRLSSSVNVRHAAAGLHLVIYSAGLIVVMLYFPAGLAGALNRIAARWTRAP